ncbi:uncharacterized protein Dana_GF28079 [Drosophila ananassae]|uniref:Uncharacterized protein n=1 Tax=Drosophila ananassae TaxID=7217 RepID=A0A0P8XVT4_DROAN|nr:uncharacterized protein LOC26515488 [Drosophila ananassae]KPU73463.1 uncharacterized protein Dana_GF28079 [Drosophila ananassae]
MISKTLILFLMAFLCAVLLCEAKEYQFLPARCRDLPGIEKQIGGPMSLCSFPPGYQTPDSEDIQAVINHIKTLKLN